MSSNTAGAGGVARRVKLIAECKVPTDPEEPTRETIIAASGAGALLLPSAGYLAFSAMALCIRPLRSGRVR